jgi:hypothetical protein
MDFEPGGQLNELMGRSWWMEPKKPKNPYNQSNQERAGRWDTYKARSFGRGFHINKIDIGRRSLHGDDLGQLRRTIRASDLSADIVVVLSPADLEFIMREMLMFLFEELATRLKDLDQFGRIHDQKDCLEGQSYRLSAETAW